MPTTPIQPLIPGVLGVDNLLSSADMSTYWNGQAYPNPRSRFVIVMTANGSRVHDYAIPEGSR